MKLSQIVDYCSLDKIKEDIGIELNGFYGENIVVGVIDGGIDFNHSHFKNEDGTTRFKSIWDQTLQISNAKYGTEGPNGKGRVFTNEEINQILLDNTIQDKYMELGHKPNKNSHGTHVTDIVAGNGQASGIASKSTLIFVNIEASDTIFQSIRNQQRILEKNTAQNERKLKHTNQLIEAAKYIFDEAGDRPCVINISLGGREGPHDGTNHIEQAFDALIKEKQNRAIVISAGNDKDKHSHVSGMIQQNETKEIKWEIKSNNNGHSQFEIWYSGNDTFEISIFNENGNTTIVENCNIGESGNLLVDGDVVGHIYHDKDNNDNCIFVFFNPKSNLQHKLKIQLLGKNITSGGYYHGWTSSYQRHSSSFLDDTIEYTVNSIATGEHTITVGSYSTYHQNSISHFSSNGPTRDGRHKPDLSAPGQDIWATGALTNKLTKMSGTSQAAPVVSGIIARIFEIAQEQNVNLSIDDTKRILFHFCRKDKLGDEEWNSNYGYGMVNNIPKDFSITDFLDTNE